ncbi:DUF4349 domain-containing protein [Streptomyces sp. NPDC087212]|uniref:DUF4349 domain-containing protein n=1 Tax=Streptomyces sp. NPDC087212 TaxID=3365766 RepID=UPI00382FDC3E
MRTRRSTGPVHALSGLLLAAALALTGCSGDSDTSGGSASGASAAQEDLGSGDKAARGDAESSASELTEGHIIRTAELTVRVEDVDKALRAARTTTRDAGGYVGEESTVRDDGGPAYTTVTLRVPVAEYDAVLADLQGAGVLLERSARARDVTDKVVDVESRVTSRRASVTRVRALMLSDVVALEKQLSDREADLEALLARQASLKDRVELATVTLDLTAGEAKEAAEGQPGFLDAPAGGWGAFLTFLRWIALAVGAALPFAAPTALLVWAWLKLARPRLRRRPPTEPTNPPDDAERP